MKSMDLGPRGEQVDGGSEGWEVPGGRNCKLMNRARVRVVCVGTDP